MFAVKEINRLGIVLGTLLFKPMTSQVPLEREIVSMNNCLRHADLLRSAAEITILRADILRQLVELANLIPLAVPFRQYDPHNVQHLSNAGGLLGKLHPDYHHIVGMAFALVMNPVNSATDYSDSPSQHCTEMGVDSLVEI